MSVYIEYVIIDNFILTYTIGLLSYRALKTKKSTLRNIFSAGLGTVCAVFYPFMRVGIISLLGIRFALLGLLSLILFYKKSKLLISSAVFLGITFLFGGVFFGLAYVIHGNAKSALTLPAFDFPIGIILIGAWFLYLILKRLLIKFHKNRGAKAGIYRVELEAEGKSLSTDGFFDSGNRVFDHHSGLPVVIISFRVMERLLEPEVIIKLIGGKGEESYKGARSIDYIPYGAKPQKLWLLSSQKFLLYFDGDKNINIDVMLGLSVQNFKDVSDYGLIFGPDIVAKIPEKNN